MGQKVLDEMLGRRNFFGLAAKGAVVALSTAFALTSAFAGNQHPDHIDHKQYTRYHEEGYQHLEIGENEINGKLFVLKLAKDSYPPVPVIEKKQIGPAIYSREITAAGGQITEYTVGVKHIRTIKAFKPDANGSSILDIKGPSVVFYDGKGGEYLRDVRSSLPYFEETTIATEQLKFFSLERELPGFNYAGHGKFRGNIEDVVLSKPLEDIQAKVIIYASESELREYEHLQKKGILPKTLKGITFIDSAEAEKMKGNGTIKSVGRYDFGVLGHLKLLKSDVDPVLLSMALNHWLEMSKKVFAGKTLRAAEGHGAKYARLITDDSPSDGTRYSGTLTGKVQGGGHFLGWGINGQFSGMIGSNSDYSLLGACELYKGK